MLYIIGDTSKTWPTLIRILTESAQLQMVALLYPGQLTFPPKFLPSGSLEELEPVTTWGENESPTASARLPVSYELLDELASDPTSFFVGDWDFAVYRTSEHKWVACTIPHEEMVLVSDDQILELLQEAGLPVSNSAPDWW